MGLLPLNHFDDPPQLSLQVVLLALKRIMCLRLSSNRGLSRTRTRTHCISASAKYFRINFIRSIVLLGI